MADNKEKKTDATDEKMVDLEAQLAESQAALLESESLLERTAVELDEANDQIAEQKQVATITKRNNGEFPLVLRRIGTNLVAPWTAARARKSGWTSCGEEEARECHRRKEAADRARVGGQGASAAAMAQGPRNVLDPGAARPSVAQLVGMMSEEALHSKAAQLKVHVAKTWKIETIRKHVAKAMVKMEE